MYIVFDVIYVSMFICLKYMDFRIVEFIEKKRKKNYRVNKKKSKYN